MKEGWKYERLGDICHILNGYAFKSSHYVQNGIRVIRITNVQKGYVIDSLPKFYPITKQNKLSNYMLEENDLLMSLTGNVGRVGILSKELLPAALNQRVACLRIKKNRDINKKYLFHYLNSDYFENICICNSTGAAQLNMSTVWLANHILPIPPLHEQERIVSLLDAEFAKIDAIKANAEKQLQDAKALFQSALKDLLTSNEGWKYKRLGDICDILDSKRKPITKNKRESGKIPYYGATGILDYVKDYIFDEPLVLLGEDGAKWGASEKSAYYIKGKTWVNNHAHVLRPHRNEILDSFLIFYLNYSDLTDYITGVTVPKLNQEKMRGISIPIPSLHKQERIVTLLDAFNEKIQSLQQNCEQTITLCNDLKQSILKDIFG